MRKTIYTFALLMGLMLIGGLTTTVSAQNGNNTRRPKNTGTLTVKTSPQSYPVRVNNQLLGMSGKDIPAEFYLPPGTHQLVIEGPNGKNFTKDIEIRKDLKNCICLRIVEEVVTRACPYNVSVTAPERVIEGDLITFASINNGVDTAFPVNYRWAISPDNLVITSGQGTSSITVDTRGMGGQTVNAFLDVTDDVYGATCQQKNSVPTIVERIPPPPDSRRFDEFDSQAFDDDKARFDAFAIELQNNPDSQGYIIMYQGTSPGDMRNRRVEALTKRTLDYLVKARGIDPARLQIVNWGSRPRTRYELWIIPPGAQPPVPQ